MAKNIYDARFDMPDTLTVRQQLAIRNRITRAQVRGSDLIPLWWEIGKELMTGWSSDSVPDPTAVDLDTETNPAVANVVWEAALMVADWFHSLGNVEKNS